MIAIYDHAPATWKVAQDLFPGNYTLHRQAFLDACGQSKVHTHPHPATGPKGERLAVDILLLGPGDAPNILVLLSATHGVEGPAGSAIQTDFLRHADITQLPEDLDILMIHALNPHGFAWGRRVNEEGVDINRNFVDFSLPLPKNPGYDTLAELLVPRSSEPDVWTASQETIQRYRLEHGDLAWDQAIASGQYGHPHGLFYGGTQASWSRELVESVWRDFSLTQRTRITVVDIHTGLGPYGHGELICDLPKYGPGHKRAISIFGPSVTHPLLGDSVSGIRHGLSDYGWFQALGDRMAFVTLEFGTAPFRKLLEILRRDHFFHCQNPSTAKSMNARREMEGFFNPPEASWREMILSRGRQVVRQAMAEMM